MPRNGGLCSILAILSSLFPATLRIGEQAIASIESSISLGTNGKGSCGLNEDL